MANATALIVTALSLNSTAAQPTADILDTGTSPVTLSLPVGGEGANILLEVTNNKTGTNVLGVSVAAGTNPPALNAGQGALSKTGVGSSTTIYLGPFEGARFEKTDGTLSLTITPNTDVTNMSAAIRCYKLPRGS